MTDREAANAALSHAFDVLDSVDRMLAEGAEERAERAQRIQLDRMMRQPPLAPEPRQRGQDAAAAAIAQRAAEQRQRATAEAWAEWFRSQLPQVWEAMGAALAETRREIEAQYVIRLNSMSLEIDSLRSEITELRGQLETIRREASPPAKLRRVK